MGAVRAFVFLEVQSFVNKPKHYQKHRFQASLYALTIVLFILSLLSIPQGTTIEYPYAVDKYAAPVLGGFILVSIINALIVRARRLPVVILGGSENLILSVPASNRIIVMYYFLKQLVIQAAASLLIIYSAILLLGGTFLPSGILFAWAGTLLFSMWTTILSILSFSLRKRLQLDSATLLGCLGLLGAATFTISGGSLEAFWATIHPQNWWPANWFFSLICRVFNGDELHLFREVFGLLALNGVLFGLAMLTLDVTREDLGKEIHRNSTKLTSEMGKEITDPDEALIRIFGAKKRVSIVSGKSWPSGVYSALIWKELVTWERVKPIEFRFAFASIGVISVALGLAHSLWDVPVWLVLYAAMLNGADGGKGACQLFHPLQYRIPGSWFSKLSCIGLMSTIENSFYSGVSILMVFFTVLAAGGFAAFSAIIPLLLPLFVLIISATCMAISLGTFTHLLSLRLLGVYRLTLRLFPSFVHLTAIVAVASRYQWRMGPVFFIGICGLALSVFWIWLASRYLDKGRAKLYT